MRRIPWVSLFIITSAAAVHAQPKVGNWVAGNSWAGAGASPASLVYMDPMQSAPAVLNTIRVAGLEGRVNSCSMHPNNRDFLVGFTSLTQLALVDLNGTIVSLAAIPSAGKGHVMAEDGSVFMVSGADIYKVDITNNTSAKFNKSALPPLMNDVALDHRTGDLITGGINSIIALDATTGAISKTITTAVPSPFRIVHDPVSDDFFVSEGARSAWNRVTRAGVVTWTKINIGAGGLKAVQQRGTILTGASNRLAMMDASGSVVGGRDHQYPRTNTWAISVR